MGNPVRGVNAAAYTPNNDQRPSIAMQAGLPLRISLRKFGTWLNAAAYTSEQFSFIFGDPVVCHSVGNGLDRSDPPHDGNIRFRKTKTAA